MSFNSFFLQNFDEKIFPMRRCGVFSPFLETRPPRVSQGRFLKFLHGVSFFCFLIVPSCAARVYFLASGCCWCLAELSAPVPNGVFLGRNIHFFFACCIFLDCVVHVSPLCVVVHPVCMFSSNFRVFSVLPCGGSRRIFFKEIN